MTKFIEALKFNEDFRSFKAGDLFTFTSGINLIVGDQGCGKSSLFYSIMNWQESGISMVYDQSKQYRFIDSERMNPRLTDSFKAHREFDDVRAYDKAEFNATVDSLMNDYHRQSHGQVLLPIMLGSSEKDVTYFIDEPEAGLSIRSQHKLWQHYVERSKYSQFIVATHSLVLIQNAGKVLSLEHKRWMSSDEFLNSQQTSANQG